MALLAGSPLTQARREGAGQGTLEASEQMTAGASSSSSGGNGAGEEIPAAAAVVPTAQSSVSFVVRRSGVQARVHPSSAVAAGVEAALEQLKRAEALARKGGAKSASAVSSSALGGADQEKARSPAPDTVVYHEVHRTRRVYLRCCTGVWDEEARAWRGLLSSLSQQ